MLPWLNPLPPNRTVLPNELALVGDTTGGDTPEKFVEGFVAVWESASLSQNTAYCNSLDVRLVLPTTPMEG